MPNISFEIIVLNSLFSLFFFYSSLEIFLFSSQIYCLERNAKI